MPRILILSAALIATWLVWSGLYKTLLLGLGAVSVGLTVWLAARMDLFDSRVFTLDLAPKLVRFWITLLVEIIRSNFTVAKIILDPRLPISPTMIALKTHSLGLIGQATFANSITLTPGTLSVDVHEGRVSIHCLTQAGARETDQTTMGEQIARGIGSR